MTIGPQIVYLGMRFLLGALFIVAATVLFCHGYFFHEESLAAVGNAPHATSANLPQVEANWPYSEGAIQVRQTRLDSWKTSPPSEVGEESTWRHIENRVKAGWSERAPFLWPHLAGALGLAGLLLAVLMPRTRFRGLTLLVLLLGALALAPGFLPPSHQAGLLAEADMVEPLVTQMPRIAGGLLLFAGLAIGLTQRPGYRNSSD